MSEPYWIPLGAGSPPPPSGSVIARATSDLDITNTVAETTLFGFTVPGNMLGVDKAIGIDIWCDMTKDANLAAVKFKYGSAIPVVVPGTSIVVGPPRVPFFFKLILAAKGLTNAQHIAGQFSMSLASQGTATTGLGMWEHGGGGDGDLGFVGAGDCAVDSTIDQPFAVTVQWNVVTTACSWRRRYAEAILR